MRITLIHTSYWSIQHAKIEKKTTIWNSIWKKITHIAFLFDKAIVQLSRNGPYTFFHSTTNLLRYNHIEEAFFLPQICTNRRIIHLLINIKRTTNTTVLSPNCANLIENLTQKVYSINRLVSTIARLPSRQIEEEKATGDRQNSPVGIILWKKWAASASIRILFCIFV